MKLRFILLFLLIATLSAGVAWLWFNPPPKPNIKISAPATLPLTDVAQYLAELDPVKSTAKKIAYQSILERPLFVENRRKPKPYVPPPPKPKPKPTIPPKPQPKKDEPPPDFKLVAIIQKIESRNLPRYEAYLNHNSQVIKVKSGDNIEGWRVSSIRMDRMTLIKGAEIMHLNLRHYGDAPTAKKAGPMQLLAINQINGQPYAYISGTSEGTVKLKQGQKIDGWEIITIDKDQVKLYKDREEKKLYLWQYEARSSGRRTPPKRALPRQQRPPAKPKPANVPRRN